jgi:hypothetical protein
MESYTQLIPLNNYLNNCVIKLHIKLQFLPPNFLFFSYGCFTLCFKCFSAFIPPSPRADFNLCFSCSPAAPPPPFRCDYFGHCQVGPTSCLGSKSGARHDVPSPRCRALSCDMACFIINDIVKLFKLCFLGGFFCPSIPLPTLFPLPMACAWVLEVNPLGTLHLGFSRHC